MARAKDIAALAGLAGLAYAYNKNKGKPNEDAGKQETSSYTKDTKKVAASDDRMSNEDYIKSRMKKAPEDSDEGYKSSVLKAVTATKEAPNYQSGNQGVLGGSTSSPKPKPKRTGMTGAQNTALANAGKQAKMAAENDALAKANTGASKTTPPAATPSTRPTTRSTNILEEAKEEARRRAAASQATPTSTSTSSSTSPTTRYSFPGSSALNKKNGGAVKMASGGMTASRRGDGIAQRGKTRGKMC